MGEIADDCYDRGIDELFDSYDDHDQYEDMERYFKKPHIPATRAEVLDDFESEDEQQENNDFDLEDALYDTIRASGWASKEATGDIVDRVLQLLAEHDYI